MGLRRRDAELSRLKRSLLLRMVHILYVICRLPTVDLIVTALKLHLSSSFFVFVDLSPILVVAGVCCRAHFSILPLPISILFK